MLALEHVVGGFHVLQTAVGAAADHNLIDLDVLALAGKVGVLGQVGVADGGFQLVQIDLNGLFVLGIRVGLKEHRLTLAAALEVAAGHIVHREDAVLGTGFDGHVADAQAVVHRQAGNARAGELHGFVQRTVHTDHADDVQDQVLAGDAGAELALEHELDGRGHLEPCHAGGHAGSHIGGADTGGEGTQCTIGAGVAVRTDHAVACGHDAFFRQQSVLNAHLAHIVEVKDVVLVGELAALLGLGGALDVLVGHKVVQHDGNVLFVEHTVKTGLFKLVDGNRGGDVVAQYDVQLCIDELASLDLGKTGMCGKNFLRQGHSHDGTLLLSVGRTPSGTACAVPAPSRREPLAKREAFPHCQGPHLRGGCLRSRLGEFFIYY